MKHSIKIEQHYLIHIVEGIKTFEVRKNDRDYQVGDTIYFMPIESKGGYDVYKSGYSTHFRITYVHHCFGMQEGYVVLGIMPSESFEL